MERVEQKKNETDAVKTVGMKKRKVLLVFPLFRDYKAVETLPKAILERYEFHFIDSPHFGYSSRAGSKFSMVSFIDECKDVVSKQGIDIVISTRDMADLVHSVLASHFERICGPTILSSFVTLYKPLTRQYVDIDPPSFDTIHLKQLEDIISNPKSEASQVAIKKLIWKMNGKGFLKPPAASCSSLVGSFTDESTLLDLFRTHKSHSATFGHYLTAFANQYLSNEKIDGVKLFDVLKPSELGSVVLAEEFMDTPIKVTVDGCVANGEIHLWVIADNVYWTQIGFDECFVGCVLPSQLSDGVCALLSAKYREHVSLLIEKFGFNNQFIDIEFFILPKHKRDTNDWNQRFANPREWHTLSADDVSLKIMEINARCAMQYCPVYRQLFESQKNGISDGDILQTMLKIGENHLYSIGECESAPEIKTPKMKKGVCGLNGYLLTVDSGLTQDLFDFEAAKKYVDAGEVVLVADYDTEIATVSSQGSLLAYANVMGDCYQTCFDRFIEIGNTLIKKGAPWNETEQIIHSRNR